MSKELDLYTLQGAASGIYCVSPCKAIFHNTKGLFHLIRHLYHGILLINRRYYLVWIKAARVVYAL